MPKRWNRNPNILAKPSKVTAETLARLQRFSVGDRVTMGRKSGEVSFIDREKGRLVIRLRSGANIPYAPTHVEKANS